MSSHYDEKLLSHDVSFLDELLGDQLRELGDSALWATTQTIRIAAKERRQHGPDAPLGKAAQGRLDDAIAGLSPALAVDVMRAFGQHFGNTNLAERVHRIRRRKQSFETGQPPQQGSLTQVVTQLAQDGVAAETVLVALQELMLQPVFTAHPTEATRRTLLRKEQRMAQALMARHTHGNAPLLARTQKGILQAEMAAAWQTETLADAPSVANEVEHVTFYLTEVLYPIVPHFYEGIQDALSQAYGDAVGKKYATWAEATGPWVRFGTWVGGDMDGNPSVSADTLWVTLEQQRAAILRAYGQDVQRLIDRLSHSSTRVTVAAEVHSQCDAARRVAPWVVVPERHRDMPYRVLLHHVAARLVATSQGATAQGSYLSPDALLADLTVIADSLEGHSGRHGGSLLVRRLMRRVATFGLHMAALDVRQDSLVHKEAACALLMRPDLLTASTEARHAAFSQALHKATLGRPPWATPPCCYAASDTEPLPRMLAVMATIQRAQQTFGAQSIGWYIISMAHDVDDVLAVLLLAHAAGLTQQAPDGTHQVPLAIAPLFETVPDLSHSTTVVSAMLDHPAVRRHLAHQHDVLPVMLGYSDSNKESGFVASRWTLIEAQEALIRRAQEAQVTLRLFHGRGGTASRGGSKPKEAIMADPDDSGCVRLTEQGEMIHAKYGLEDVALRTLELMGGALLTRKTARKQAPRSPHFDAALRVCSHSSRTAYRELVVHTPAFFAYFNAATPIDVITRLRIGSRPASRRTHEGIGDLRAIPWVFSWMQNRQMLPGWYGLGDGLAACRTAHGDAILPEMYAQWPFFKNLIDDAALGLAKCDMAIGERYAALAGPLGVPIWQRIQSAYAVTCDHVAHVMQSKTMLASEPRLAQAIALRNPYVDPMSLMQLDALTRWRAGGRTDAALLRVLMLSVKGIARGLGNTG